MNYLFLTLIIMARIKINYRQKLNIYRVLRGTRIKVFLKKIKNIYTQPLFGGI